jgi:membrane-bound serine protease (ClpP class)
MQILVDPNVGYVLLVGGVLLAILALFAPGSGIIEIGALGAIVLAGYILVSLPVNGWAIAVLVVGVLPFVLALRFTHGRRSMLFLGVAIVALVVGSIFAFRNPQGGPAINPWLAVVVSGGSGVFLWFIARKSLDAAARTPAHNLDHLVGMTGVAHTDIRPEGSVYVNGEEWSAFAKSYIPTGTPVRVLSRNGLVLTVEKVKQED